MPNLRVRPHAPAAAGLVLEVSPKSAGWDHVGFAVHKLAAGQTASGNDPGREVCLVILSGTADIAAGSERYTGVGGRRSVFEDKAPAAAYVPAGMAWSVTARDAVELAVCSAPGTGARIIVRVPLSNGELARD